MESPRTLGGVPPCELDRIASLERHGFAPPLREANGPTLEHVDRRNDVEVVC